MKKKNDVKKEKKEKGGKLRALPDANWEEDLNRVGEKRNPWKELSFLSFYKVKFDGSLGKTKVGENRMHLGNTSRDHSQREREKKTKEKAKKERKKGEKREPKTHTLKKR